MQMPRGNLEGIQPRIILCKHLILMIQRKQYRKAFLLIRKHKVDLNMLYDVNPEQFFEEIDLFVRQIREVDFLNLFINSLSNESRGRELDFMWPRKPEDVITQQISEATQKYQIEVKESDLANCKVTRVC